MEHTFIFIGDVELSYEMGIVIVREAINLICLESHMKCYELFVDCECLSHYVTQT